MPELTSLRVFTTFHKQCLASNQKLPDIQRGGAREKYTIETDTETIQTLELSVTECKITVINMFKKIDDKMENFIRDLKSMH